MVVSPRLLFLCVSAVATACTAPGCRAPGNSETGALGRRNADYRCGEQRVAATFTGDALVLSMGAHTHRLTPVPSASGARYVAATGSGRIVFWDKGGRARLEPADAPAVDCTRLPESARVRPLPFEARGNEPGWLLTITDDRMRLEYAYGSKEARAPRPEPTVTPDGYRYVAAAGTRELRVRIRNQRCVDSMSGMYYPAAVTVRVAGETLSGCGGDPADLLTGEAWKVEDLAGQGVIDASRVTLRFRPDGRLGGHASCNRYTASYALTGELDIGSVTSTRKACAPALMNQEQLFLRLLRNARRFEITDTGALRLVTTGGQAVTARRHAPPAAPEP